MTAAYKGLSRVVSRLIELGADVNAGGRKATPLHYSVVGQSLAAAKVLLEQGADVLAVNEQGKNVLEYARTFPFLKGKKREQFLQLLERYQDRPAKPGARHAKPEKPKQRGKESATKKKRNVARKREVVPLPEFSQAARNKKYVAALDELERLCGSKRQALDGLEGAFLFQVEVSRELDVVKLQRRLLIQGAYIVALDFSGPTNPPQRLLCFATTDKYKAVTAMQTAGPNHGLSTRGIIQWLRKTEKEQPLIFTNIGRDVVAGQFVTAIKNAEKLAQRMIEFCPGIEDAHDDLADFAKELRKHRRFDFWWD